MARMIPAVPGEATLSSAEKKLFAVLQQQLPDSWTVLHSLGLVLHAKKPWAEIDFVLVGPDGVFCLEVKGGGVSRHSGEWHFTDRFGNINAKAEGPFQQVGSATAALYRFLKDNCASFNAIVGYGVMLPDIVFQEVGPDIEPAVLYDGRDWERPLTQYIRRLAVYWRERLGRVETQLTPLECNAIIDTLRGDFDFRKPLSLVAKEVCNDLLSLTTEQYRALDMMEDNPRCIIKGGAGTGKTLLAAEEVRRAAQDNKSVLLCCYSQNLASFLGSHISGAKIRVDSLHNLMREYVSAANLTANLPDAEEHYLYEVGYPEVCIEALMQLDDFDPFDVIVVDEAQDLMLDPYLDVLDILVKGGLEQGSWRFFLDPKQNVFRGIQQGIHERLRRCHPAVANLSVNCRNTRPIAVNTALLCGLPPDIVARTEGPDVEIYWYRDRAHQQREVSKFVGRVLSGGVRPEQIVVLSPNRIEASAAARGLTSSHGVADLTDTGAPAVGNIGFSTISAFKGLESDFVAVVDINRLLDPDLTSLLYVGASRCRVLLALFIDQAARPEFEQRSREFGARMAAAQ